MKYLRSSAGFAILNLGWLTVVFPETRLTNYGRFLHGANIFWQHWASINNMNLKNFEK